MSLKYARGSRAWGMCARSGRKMLLLDMVRDPLTDLLVDPDWAEPPLMRPPTDITDGVALEHPAPDLDRIGTAIYLGRLFDIDSGDIFRPLVSKYECGNLTVTTFGTGSFLLTESGLTLLTEDGVPIMLEGPSYITTENGIALMTEDNQNILI